MRKPFLIQVLCLGVIFARELAAPEDIEMLKKSRFMNEDEIAMSVNFFKQTRDPYPKGFKGYNVDIDYSKNCYVVFENEDKSAYRLVESSHMPEGNFGVFVTHTGPCGVCSHLQDLAVYLETPDLTTPVTKCAKMLIPENKKNCLRRLGFSERCMAIWYWNTIYTRRGCFNICIRYQYKARNQPVGSYNPCQPISQVLPGLDEDPDIDSPDLLTDSPDLQVAKDKSTRKGKKSSSRGNRSRRARELTESGKKLLLSFWKKKKVGCRNSINHMPACKEHQWKNNPQRLNPCIQCDECKSGPMFQKVSGRQRRNSGIRSGIDRPGTANLDHHYFTGYEPPMLED